MHHLIRLSAAALIALLVSGCATTIRSDVLSFHHWPAQLADRSYAFEAPDSADNTLEYQSYENLVRAELAQLGLREAPGSTAALRVALRFATTELAQHTLEPLAPMMFNSAFYRPGMRFGPPGRVGGFAPFYDPFWRPFPTYAVTTEAVYRRELQLAIRDKQDLRLFEVSVHNTSDEPSTPAVMPALVHSAFVGFPGPSGVARRIELTEQRQPNAPALPQAIQEK